MSLLHLWTMLVWVSLKETEPTDMNEEKLSALPQKLARLEAIASMFPPPSQRLRTAFSAASLSVTARSDPKREHPEVWDCCLAMRKSKLLSAGLVLRVLLFIFTWQHS